MALLSHVGDTVADPPLLAAKTPSVPVVHASLILVQIIFGIGSVVGKLGVAQFNPLLFALIREVVAGLLLHAWAVRVDGPRRPQREHCLLFCACGFFIFVNQAAFIVGDKLAGAVAGSAWQPTQPIFTLLISLVLGWEKPTLLKTAGIVISFGGAAFMVVYGADASSAGGASSFIAGNTMFAANCLGTATVCKSRTRTSDPSRPAHRRPHADRKTDGSTLAGSRSTSSSARWR